MDKKFLIVSTILLFILASVLLIIPNKNNTLPKVDDNFIAFNNDLTTTTSTNVTTTKPVKVFGEIKGNVSKSKIDLFKKQVSYIPNKIKTRFINEGWHIYITDEDLAKTYFNGKYKSVQGLTDYKNKTILIEQRDKAIKESVIHEIGHFVDYILGFKSNTIEFDNIYNSEVKEFKNNIKNPGCVRDKREFFAETFYYLYTDSRLCTNNAKKYLTNLINNM